VRKFIVWEISSKDCPVELEAWTSSDAARQAVEDWDIEHLALGTPEEVVVKDVRTGVETKWTVEAEAVLEYYSYAAGESNAGV
jgi:hypothetical protein